MSVSFRITSQFDLSKTQQYAPTTNAATHLIIDKLTAHKMKFSIRDFFSKCDQILDPWLHLLKKLLMENFTICALTTEDYHH